MEIASQPTFTAYAPDHRVRLRRRAGSREWREILSRTAALEELRAEVRVPSDAPVQMSKANDYLMARNSDRTRELIRRGVRDEEELLASLGNWETALDGDDAFPLVFLGLVMTLDCSFMPRCVYCNQIGMPRRLGLSDWKRLVDEASEPVPPYVYLTGGEPLMLAAEVWGEHGLVAHATDRGCAVNINTNAALITPQVALHLVRAGTAKLHISIDTAEQAVGDGLLGQPERTSSVLEGLMNVQIAREVLGTDHPTIHVNSVLTARNLDSIPELLRFVLGMRREGASSGDLAMHLIPVGGAENALLRPTTAEWKRFYTATWEKAEAVWADHQAASGVAEADRERLPDAYPFVSPWHRVRHAMDLDEYCREAARGSYWQGALTDRCYVCPTQAFVLPDGSQHWCGAHAIRRPAPIGNVLEASLRENIRRGATALAALPGEACAGCAGATCAINQSAERNLRRRIAELLATS